MSESRALRSPSLPTSALRVFDLSLGEMLWSRRTIFMALIVGAPVAIAVVFRALELFGMSSMRVNGARVSGPTIFGILIWFLYVKFIVPILGVFYGTALMADEVEDKTITYLFTRPISRGAVLLGKYLAYLACTLFVVLPSVVLVFFLIVPIGGGSIAGAFMSLIRDLMLLGLGLIVYGAVFAFVGGRLKRPLVVGLVFAFGWEQTVLLIPGYLKRLTVAYYLQALVPHAMPQDGVVSLLQSVFRETPSAAASVAWLAAMWAVFLWRATRAVERREYVLEQ